jgi:hypothetical protein
MTAIQNAHILTADRGRPIVYPVYLVAEYVQPPSLRFDLTHIFTIYLALGAWTV